MSPTSTLLLSTPLASLLLLAGCPTSVASSSAMDAGEYTLCEESFLWAYIIGGAFGCMMLSLLGICCCNSCSSSKKSIREQYMRQRLHELREHLFVERDMNYETEREVLRSQPHPDPEERDESVPRNACLDTRKMNLEWMTGNFDRSQWRVLPLMPGVSVEEVESLQQSTQRRTMELLEEQHRQQGLLEEEEQQQQQQQQQQGGEASALISGTDYRQLLLEDEYFWGGEGGVGASSSSSPSAQRRPHVQSATVPVVLMERDSSHGEQDPLLGPSHRPSSSGSGSDPSPAVLSPSASVASPSLMAAMESRFRNYGATHSSSSSGRGVVSRARPPPTNPQFYSSLDPSGDAP